MQSLEKFKNLTVGDDLAVIKIDDSDVGIIDELNDSRYRNRGTILYASSGVEKIGVGVGDMVHFGDMSGVFPFKHLDRNIYVLHKDDILFVSDDATLYVGEDMSFYMLTDVSRAENGRWARI